MRKRIGTYFLVLERYRLMKISRMSTANSIEALRDLAQSIVEDNDKIQSLNQEEIVELRKYMDPLGAGVTEKKKYINLSITNWKDSLLRKLYLMCFVGYAYRTLEEYEPEDELAEENTIYQKRLDDVNHSSESNKIKEERRKAETESHEKEVARIKQTHSRIIKKFLDRNFDFNPDYHLRGVKTTNPADPDRATAAKPDPRPSPLTDLDQIAEVKDHILTAYQHINSTVETLAKTIISTSDAVLDKDDLIGILTKNYYKLDQVRIDLAELAVPIAEAGSRAVWEVNPPVNVLHHFDRYLTNHYEQLRDICTSVFNEKPDIEFAITPVSIHKTPEDARSYRLKHESEFRTDIFTIETGATSLLGPFKENRARIDYYNKNTEVLKRMSEQNESDHKLGKDIMEKRIKAVKQKNIEEAGPDSPELAAYSKAMNIVQELGVKKGLSRDDEAALAKAREDVKLIKEDYEVPDDAIQTDVHYPVEENGKMVLKKKKMYTQAEAPLHLEEGSPYVDQYQPKRVGTKNPLVKQAVDRATAAPPPSANRRQKREASRHPDVAPSASRISSRQGRVGRPFPQSVPSSPLDIATSDVIVASGDKK